MTRLDLNLRGDRTSQPRENSDLNSYGSKLEDRSQMSRESRLEFCQSKNTGALIARSSGASLKNNPSGEHHFSFLKFSLISSVLLGFLAIPLTATAQEIPDRSNLCPEPVLERLKPHQIAPGETIESIAEQYNLFPETIIRLNPTLADGNLSVGQEIFIPPFNGIRLQVPNGATWKDLEQAYGVRADVLFEINGCTLVPQVVFLPGVSWEATGGSKEKDYLGLANYPLPKVAAIGMNYGWQENSTRQQRMFHPGLDLLADNGTSVLAADAGIVAFVGQQKSYGNLIVINHPDGWQTRYGHLANIKVKIGQQVKPGDIIGTVGYSGIPDLQQSHLHFEVRRKTPSGWVAQNPELHLK